jgi:hypothetical protein
MELQRIHFINYSGPVAEQLEIFDLFFFIHCALLFFRIVFRIVKKSTFQNENTEHFRTYAAST